MTAGAGGYGRAALDHYDNPRNAGSFQDADAAATVTNPACGDEVRISLRLRDGRIAGARFLAQGCSAAIASASVATVLIEGRSLAGAASLTGREVAEALGGLPPLREHGAALAAAAVSAALADYGRRSRPPMVYDVGLGKPPGSPESKRQEEPNR